MNKQLFPVVPIGIVSSGACCLSSLALVVSICPDSHHWQVLEVLEVLQVLKVLDVLEVLEVKGGIQLAPSFQSARDQSNLLQLLPLQVQLSPVGHERLGMSWLSPLAMVVIICADSHHWYLNLSTWGQRRDIASTTSVNWVFNLWKQPVAAASSPIAIVSTGAWAVVIIDGVCVSIHCNDSYFYLTEGNLFPNKVVWSTEWLLHQAEFRLYHAGSHGEDSALLCTFTGWDNGPVILCDIVQYCAILCDRQVQVSGWPKVLWTRWISGRAVKPMTIRSPNRSSQLPVKDYRCSQLNSQMLTVKLLNC